jgi:ComF family protein
MADGVLSAWLATAMLQLAEVAAREVVVIAVPLFAARERQRGFNQSALLSNAAVRRLKKLRPGWKLQTNHGSLARVKDTREQYVLNPRQRRANLRGAFRVVEDAAVRGREVLLVDDILTTGATARECARVLLRAGAAKVWVATVARAQPEVSVASWDESRVQSLAVRT